MKEFRSQCVRVVLTMLIALCATSCLTMEEIFEASVDVGRKRFSGNSYESREADERDVGFNVAFLMMFNLGRDNTTSFLQPGYEYNNYQLAYALAPQTLHALGKQYYDQRNSIRYQASADEFLDHLSVLSGLEFVQKNSKDEETKLRLSYLQVPVIAIYTYDLDDDTKVFGGLGPYFAYGIGGKIKGPGFSEKAFDNDFGFRRFDAGLSFTAGYKFNKKWSVRMAFDLGLANIEQESFDKTKNRCFSVNIGYWPDFIDKLVGR